MLSSFYVATSRKVVITSISSQTPARPSFVPNVPKNRKYKFFFLPKYFLLHSLLQFLIALLITKLVLAIPPNDKALYDDAEARIHKRRPCRGRGRSDPQGRTFFDWSLSYVDVNYNYNYNVNCGGGGGNGQHGGGGSYGDSGSQKPILSSILQNGESGYFRTFPITLLVLLVGNRPSGGSQQGGGLFGGNGPINFVQSQFHGIFSDGPGLGSLLPQGGIFNGEGLGSLLPQGGLFNGEGISSLFENGLFSGIFDNRPSNRPPVSSVTSAPIVTTPKPDVQDPDDIIYNDEKPVHEDHDAVVPDNYNRPYNRPGQYLVAYNPIFGEFVHDLSDFNPQRIVRQLNREFNRLAKPLAHLLGR